MKIVTLMSVMMMMMMQKMILKMMMMQKMILMMMIMKTQKLVTLMMLENKVKRRNHTILDLNVDDSEDYEDYVPKKEREKQQKQKPKNIEKLRIKSPELSQILQLDSSEVMPKTRPIKVLIYCVCLGDISETDDEIVECNNCDVAVHEGCYSISDNQSDASTKSSARTEPWFVIPVKLESNLLVNFV